MQPWQVDYTLLGMVGSATVAVGAAGLKAFTVAARFGRMLERSEQNEARIALIPGLVASFDSVKSMVARLASDHTALKTGLEKLDSDFDQLRVDVARLDGSVDEMHRSQGDFG